MNGGNDFEIVVRGHPYGLHLFEEEVPLRGAWEEQEGWRRSDYCHRQFGIEPRIRRYDKQGTGRLTITLDGYGREGRQSSWGDRRSWTLEQKLPDLLRDIEVRAVEDASLLSYGKAGFRERRSRAAKCRREAEGDAVRHPLPPEGRPAAGCHVV